MLTRNTHILARNDQIFGMAWDSFCHMYDNMTTIEPN